MLTYDDLVRVGDNDTARGEFCEAAVNQFMSSREYRDAQIGQAYYAKHNVTIEQYQKMIRTITGRQVPDYYSSNYKLKTLFFRRLVTQQVQYVLGNGLTLEKPQDKEAGKRLRLQAPDRSKRSHVWRRCFRLLEFRSS